MKIIASNKKAFFNYEVLEQFTAGMQLTGAEVKSLRTQAPKLTGSFVAFMDGRPYLCELTIAKYRHDSSPDYVPKRKRMLLLKTSEIERLRGKLSQKGQTVVPLEIGFERQWAKIVIGLVRGKKQYDKRRVIKDRDEKRQLQRLVKRS